MSDIHEVVSEWIRIRRDDRTRGGDDRPPYIAVYTDRPSFSRELFAATYDATRDLAVCLLNILGVEEDVIKLIDEDRQAKIKITHK